MIFRYRPSILLRQCPRCDRLTTGQYCARHTRARARQATYYQAHRAERLAYQRAYDARQRARREAT
jgi:hypothetical protein